MSDFDWRRFKRLLCNDLLQQWRKIWIATLALAGAGLIAYLTNVDPQASAKPALHLYLFSAVLIGGGVIFTSAIFADLHHPLQRYHYLTLPCSNLERFLSRYLLSAPLYYLYVLIAYAIFDWVAGWISNALMGTSAVPFAPFERRMQELTLEYFGLHALMFGGAIYFRSHALIKTMLFTAVIAFGLIVVQLAAVRIFFWSYFTALLPVAASAEIRLISLPLSVQAAAWILLWLWVLFVAYRCLGEHEVQREL
jgi:hypothetical protein